VGLIIIWVPFLVVFGIAVSILSIVIFRYQSDSHLIQLIYDCIWFSGDYDIIPINRVW
jgi:hypothetical protein